MISQQKKDLIYNALLIGMALPDAYIFASLTEDEIAEVSADDSLQAYWSSVLKHFEYTLLEKLNEVIDKQVHQGREAAITWMLEHTNPRYSGKPQNTLPDLHLHIDSSDPADYDTVEIHAPKKEDSDDTNK